MKPPCSRAAGLLLALALLPATLRAQEPSPEIAGLEKTAADFIIAYNERDAAAIATLFTENGELIDLTGEDITSGRTEIQTRYEELFADEDAPSIALEVGSVRIVAPGLAIEDGISHFTPPGDDAPARSVSYSAVLRQDASGSWQIASSRSLQDVTGPAGQLADLAESLKGDWTLQSDDLHVDIAFGWDDNGKFLIGELLAVTPDGEPQSSSVRIGWDAPRKMITSWTFDSAGGFAQGDWTPTESGFTILTKGSTGDGETRTANQSLDFSSPNTIVLTVTNRVINGEKLPDAEMRIVRRAPSPASE